MEKHSKHLTKSEDYYKVDAKWKLLISIFQIMFVVLLGVFIYMCSACVVAKQYSYMLIVLPLIIGALIMEKQLYFAKKDNDLRKINKVFRGGMRVLGMLY